MKFLPPLMKKLLLVFAVLIAIPLLGIFLDFQFQNTQTTQSSPTPSSGTLLQNIKPTTSTSIEYEHEKIPFTSETRNDSSLEEGKSVIQQPGISGTRTKTFEVVRDSNGTELERKLTDEKVTNPTSQITAKGTKKVVKPLEQPRYYTNSDGDEVQSPTRYTGWPAGASALCRDGSYSFSQNSRGTCSHHGGVARWRY